MADKKKKNFVVPYKKTMNLVPPEQPINWGRVMIIVLVVAVLALVGLKFGVLDPLEEKAQAQLDLSTKQTQYAALSTQMAEYNEVEAKYGRYSYGWMNEKEQALLQKEKVLEIVENTIASACTVENLSISENTMSLTISGITLDEGREIVKQLREDKNVYFANIYSAVSSEDSESHEAQMSMTVTFQKEVTE